VPSLSVVLPAHNEEATVAGVVEEVFAVAQELGMDNEIIVVNDGSADHTGDIVRTLAQRIPNLRLVEHFPSRHYGGALKAGFAAATKELIAFCPTDKQFVFSEIHRLLAKIAEADIVAGYRATRQDNPIRRLNAFGWNMAVRVLFGYLCRDIDCGLKLFRREILEHVNLVTDGALIDVELLVGAKARGYRIAEVEVTHLPRNAGRATGANLAVIINALRELISFRWRSCRELCKPRH
jgi:glycosyltransferase involved in cell wall biosynthesis